MRPSSVAGVNVQSFGMFFAESQFPTGMSVQPGIGRWVKNLVAKLACRDSNIFAKAPTAGMAYGTNAGTMKYENV
jgi:hypothetical protein